MSDVLIKPLRAYEDRGTIRDVDNEPYAAPIWLAKELEQLKLCTIVGDSSVTPNSSGEASSALKLAKKGPRWIVVDAQGAQVGDFAGKRDEAEMELARILAASQPDPTPEAEPLTAGDPSAATQSEQV